ncbi:hypothetical protein SNE40_004323 [Patella caerulea]|uniref:NADH-cytochrome b5 reductase n=1 Tax=Patella caerulea TaxID=87958 RepID=A0AAN8K5H1_PATCE
MEIDELPEKPEKPADSDCCGNGCVPCVFDLYESDVKIWEKECLRIKEGKQTEIFNQGPILCTDEYRQFELISIVSDDVQDVFIYRFQIPNYQCLGLKLGQHVIIRCYDGVYPVIRQYSPISDINQSGFFDLLIKIYANGRLSQLIKQWQIGTKVDVRGPFNEFHYKPNLYDQLYIVCMGTGIAPMVPIITSILDNENDEVILKLIFGCTNYSNILLKKQLNEWSHFWNFTVVYSLSNEDGTGCHYGKKIYLHRISQDLLQTELDLNKKYKILVCGSNSFTSDILKYLNKLRVPDTNIHRF